jgi:hypothetical protein
VFEKIPKSEISQWGLEKINYVDFLGIETFLLTFPKQNPDVGVGMVEEIGANNFKYNTQSYFMKVCKLFMFQYQVALRLRSTAWKGLVGHPKDHRKNQRNLWMNSLQQGENDVGCKSTPMNVNDKDVNSRSNFLQPSEDDVERKAKDSIKNSNN